MGENCVILKICPFGYTPLSKSCIWSFYHFCPMHNFLLWVIWKIHLFLAILLKSLSENHASILFCHFGIHSNGYLFLPPKTSFEKNKVFFFLTGYIGYSHYELWPFATIWFHWRIFPFWIRTNKFGRSKYFGHVFSITVAQFQSKRSTSRTCGCSRRVGIFYIEWLSKS